MTQPVNKADKERSSVFSGDDVLAQRRKQFKLEVKPVPRGYLEIFRSLVRSASKRVLVRLPAPHKPA